MLAIHDPDAIKKKLAGKAVWLGPMRTGLYCNSAVGGPIASVLARICTEINEHKEWKIPTDIYNALTGLCNDATIYYSNYMDKRKGEVDPSQWAAEVIANEHRGLRCNNKNLTEAFRNLELCVGHEIIWCLPIEDFDLRITSCAEILRSLRKFPNLMIFLIRDTVEVSELFEVADTIVGVDEEEMKDLVADIQATMPLPPLTPEEDLEENAGDMLLEEEADPIFDSVCDEEIKKQKQRKVKPIRSIDDE